MTTVLGTPVLAARIVARDSGQLLATTDSNGAFSLQKDSSRFVSIRIEADEHLVRETGLLPGDSRTVTIDIISTRPPFQLDYMDQLGHNAWDASQQTGTRREGLMVWNSDPSFRLISVRTIAPPRTAVTSIESMQLTSDPVPSQVLEQYARELPDAVSKVTAGRRRVARVEVAPSRLVSAEGWVQVHFWDMALQEHPGYASLGDGTGTRGAVLLYYDSARGILGCPEDIMAAAKQIYHETGHALGLYHVGRSWPPGLMGGQAGTLSEIQSLFSRDWATVGELESHHIAVLYSRRTGNAYPDVDPGGTGY